MIFSTIRPVVLAVSLLAIASAAQADGPRQSAFARYGIGGHIKPLGLHHGFHVETVAPDSDAERDQIRPHDVIVKVDGDPVRSLDHLRAILAEAYLNQGEVTLTCTRGTSISQRVVTSQLGKVEEVKRVARKRRAGDEADDRR